MGIKELTLCLIEVLSLDSGQVDIVIVVAYQLEQLWHIANLACSVRHYDLHNIANVSYKRYILNNPTHIFIYNTYITLFSIYKSRERGRDGWLVVFYVPSTARSFRDGTPIYCPLRRTWSSVNTPFRESNPGRRVAVHYTTAAPRQLHWER